MPLYDVLSDVEILGSGREAGEVIEIDEDSAAEFLENGTLAVHSEPTPEEESPEGDLPPAASEAPADAEATPEPEPTPDATPVDGEAPDSSEPAPEAAPSEPAPAEAKPWVGGHTV